MERWRLAGRLGRVTDAAFPSSGRFRRMGSMCVWCASLLEVDPVFWTACLSGSAALKMERSNAENPQNPPTELEGEGRR
jgi:hypothetical protein